MQLSDFINIATDIAFGVSAIIFGFAAFRAVTIGKALVNRVYSSRAYFTAAFAVIVIASIVLPPGVIYFPLLFIYFIMVDTTILAALERDFFHRNTLHWKRVRLIIYPLFIAVVIYTILPSSVTNSLPEIVLVAVVIGFIFIYAYTAAAAVVSARRTPDKPLRRFVTLAGLFILGLLINTLVFVFVTELLAAFLFIIFGYITYLMVMSLSPLGKVEKEIKG